MLDDIRAEIWLKLWGNMTFNPISALSRATLAGICQYPPSRDIAAAMMSEAQSVANKLGITFRVPLEKRIAGAEKVGHHKTSMLQDVEAARTSRSTRCWVSRGARSPDRYADSAPGYCLLADQAAGEEPGEESPAERERDRRRLEPILFAADAADYPHWR